MGGSGSDAPLGAPPLPNRARPAEAKPTSRGCSRSGSKTTRSSPLCQHPPLASRAPPGHIGPTVLLRCHGTLVVANSRRRPIARPASDAPVLRPRDRPRDAQRRRGDDGDPQGLRRRARRSTPAAASTRARRACGHAAHAQDRHGLLARARARVPGCRWVALHNTTGGAWRGTAPRRVFQDHLAHCDRQRVTPCGLREWRPLALLGTLGGSLHEKGIPW